MITPAVRSRASSQELACAYELAFATASAGMALVRDDGTILRANAALADLLGRDATQLHGRELARLVQHDDRAEEAASRLALARGERDDIRTDLRLVHASGRIVWVTLTRVLARGRHGEPFCLIDQMHDLTERHRADKEIVLLNNLLEQRIRRRTAELEESNEDLRGFAYSIAHDLRAPLASIDGFSAQLEGRLADALDARSAHFLQRVRAGVRQMSELTDGLLALADLSRAELQHGRVDLSALASDIAQRLREHSPARAAAFIIEPTPPAMGDQRLLANVLENLLGNAWKFTALVPQACIRFWAEPLAAGGTCYHVADNGAGFDPEFTSKLFSPFQRLHSANEFEGRGIGLALVRKIVTRHGGRVWAEGEPGRGATFHFTLAERGTPSIGT